MLMWINDERPRLPAALSGRRINIWSWATWRPSSANCEDYGKALVVGINDYPSAPLTGVLTTQSRLAMFSERMATAHPILR